MKWRIPDLTHAVALGYATTPSATRTARAVEKLWRALKDKAP